VVESASPKLLELKIQPVYKAKVNSVPDGVNEGYFDSSMENAIYNLGLQASLGLEHTLILTVHSDERGSTKNTNALYTCVFAMGCGTDGRLGTEDFENRYTPTKVKTWIRGNSRKIQDSSSNVSTNDTTSELLVSTLVAGPCCSMAVIVDKKNRNKLQ